MQPNFDEFLDSPSVPKDVSFLQSDGLLHQPSSVLPAYEHLPESRTAMEELTPGEWNDLNLYRARYNQEQQARQAVDMLAASKDSPSYGFRVNNYRHCLQCATMLIRMEQTKKRLSVGCSMIWVSSSVRIIMVNSRPRY